jgi:DNA adenine methylase
MFLSGRYYEPFLGGGAVFFALQPPESVLSDINPGLVETYEEVRKNWSKIADRLSLIPVDGPTYYEVRAERPGTSFERAVRFLYLNRTAFGGMYRENLQGQFNVPFGGGQRTPALLWQRHLLERASEALRSAKLLTCDFEKVIETAGSGDVVYCDPTYNAPVERDMFIRYNGCRFTWEDQERLSRAAFRAKERGAVVVVSGIVSPDVDGLYQEAEKVELARSSCLSAKIDGRKRVTEALYMLRRSAEPKFTNLLGQFDARLLLSRSGLDSGPSGD